MRWNAAFLLSLLPLLSLGCRASLQGTSEAKQTQTGTSGDFNHGWLNSWSTEDRKTWYLTPQGSHLLDYEIFLKLRLFKEGVPAGSLPRLTDQAVMEKFGFVYPNPNQKDAFTVDGLPFGLVPDTYSGDLATPTAKNLFIEKRTYLGYNCSACHTSQVMIEGKRYIVEGAGSNTLDQKLFFKALVGSLIKTNLEDDLKNQLWNDVDKKVFGNDRKEFERVLRMSSNRVARFVFRGLTKKSANGLATPLDSGPGRSDAVSGIINSLSGDMLRVGGKRLLGGDLGFDFSGLLSTHELAKRPENTSEDFYDSSRLVIPPLGVGDVGQAVLGRIVGKTAAYVDKDPNVASPTVPVSIPHVWKVSELECLQNNCLAQSPIVRNIGESLGVFGYVELNDATHRFKATSKIENLKKIEDSLIRLSPPAWPRSPASLGNGDVGKGRELFKEHCSGCHAMEGESNYYAQDSEGKLAYDGHKFIRSTQIDFVKGLVAGEEDANRPDMLFLTSHGAKRVHMGAITPEVIQQVQDEYFKASPNKPFPDEVLDCMKGQGDFYAGTSLATLQSCPPYEEGKQQTASPIDFLGFVTMAIAEKWFEENGISFEQQKRDYHHNHKYSPMFTRPVYKTRPLDGIVWTGPFLHNGSVRTLAQLLEVVPRQSTFKIGQIEFDEKEGGYADVGHYTFDATLPGNSNQGHKYHQGIPKEERIHLLEYLKTL